MLGIRRAGQGAWTESASLSQSVIVIGIGVALSQRESRRWRRQWQWQRATLCKQIRNPSAISWAACSHVQLLSWALL